MSKEQSFERWYDKSKTLCENLERFSAICDELQAGAILSKQKESGSIVEDALKIFAGLVNKCEQSEFGKDEETSLCVATSNLELFIRAVTIKNVDGTKETTTKIPEEVMQDKVKSKIVKSLSVINSEALCLGITVPDTLKLDTQTCETTPKPTAKAPSKNNGK